MKKRELYLIGILLVLLGVILGQAISNYRINPEYKPLNNVQITELNRAKTPLFTDDDLAHLDARFLFNRIAEEVIPSVVYIETIKPVNSTVDESHDFSFELWDRLIPQRAITVGSGVIITQNGYILTNFHVIEGAISNGLHVILNDKTEYAAHVIGIDPSTDLAVIKIDAPNLESIIIGNSDSVDLGEWVLAIGNPFRLRSTVTAGIVSALSRDLQIINDRLKIESFIQTDAAINKGNSGGALVNTAGELIGINTAIASQSGAYQGYGFAVPSNLALKVATDIIEYGEVRRALLGVSIAAVDYNRAQFIGLNVVQGVEIVGIKKNSAAEMYGIKVGDVILKVNDKTVNESNELQEKIAVMRPGEWARLLIWRNGDKIEKTVQLMMSNRAPDELTFYENPILKNPNSEENRYAVTFHEFDLGFRIMALAKQENANEFDLFVSDVFKYTEAWNRGLKKGQKILSIGEETVVDIETLKELIFKKITENNSVLLKIENEDRAIGYIELERN